MACGIKNVVHSSQRRPYPKGLLSLTLVQVFVATVVLICLDL